MAGLARRAGRQVIHRLGYRRHSGKGLAVVAARATVEDAGVDHHPNPHYPSEHTNPGPSRDCGNVAVSLADD